MARRVLLGLFRVGSLDTPSCDPGKNCWHLLYEKVTMPIVGDIAL